MNRLILRTLALLALVCAFAVPAQADVHWNWKEVKWRIARFENGSSTTPVRAETTFAHVGAVGLADTSLWTTLERCAWGNATDSLTAGNVAYWVFVSDTSAAYTASLTALTVATDVGSPVLTGPTGASAFIVSDQAVTNAVDGGNSQLVTTGDKIVAYPIILGAHPPAVSSDEALVQAFPIRCRVTAGVGVQGLAQARVFAVYPIDEP